MPRDNAAPEGAAQDVRRKGGGSVSLTGAIAIGVGGMMGAAIYTLLGLAASITGPWIPVAFVIGGLVSAFSVYSYAKLGAAFPNRGERASSSSGASATICSRAGSTSSSSSAGSSRCRCTPSDSEDTQPGSCLTRLTGPPRRSGSDWSWWSQSSTWSGRNS